MAPAVFAARCKKYFLHRGSRKGRGAALNVRPRTVTPANSTINWATDAFAPRVLIVRYRGWYEHIDEKGTATQVHVISHSANWHVNRASRQAIVLRVIRARERRVPSSPSSTFFRQVITARCPVRVPTADKKRRERALSRAHEAGARPNCNH